jgi:hypothetical protein
VNKFEITLGDLGEDVGEVEFSPLTAPSIPASPEVAPPVPEVPVEAPAETPAREPVPA